MRGPAASSKTVALNADIGRNRLPAVTSMDVFNLFNAGTELGRQYDFRMTGATGFNKVLEIMNARVARLGLRASSFGCPCPSVEGCGRVLQEVSS